MDVDESIAKLESRLECGQRRVQSAMLGSPEWEAATANTDALQHRLNALRPVPLTRGEHVISRLGPMVLEDGWVVEGIIAALDRDGQRLRLAMSEIPDRVHSRHAFVKELVALVRREEFILETTETADRGLSLYAWDPGSRPSTRPAPG